MPPSPSITQSAGIWKMEKVTQILSSTTDLIQLRPSDEDETKNSGDPFQAMVHKDLLCFFSTYYRAALQGGFLEASNKSVVLDLKTADCQYLVGWLYSGRLPDVSRNQLFGLYVFADKTDVLALRRAIMTRIVTSENQMLPAFSQAAVALNSLPSSSPLYRYLLDTYTHHWLSKYPTSEDMLPNGFLVDWIKRAADRTCKISEEPCSKYPCCEENSCNYHEHESVEEWTYTCGASKDFSAKRRDHSRLVNKTNPKTNGA
ncbi:hypothetical protein KCU64_g3849, partial [Aureobasidium melanogenum]